MLLFQLNLRILIKFPEFVDFWRLRNISFFDLLSFPLWLFRLLDFLLFLKEIINILEHALDILLFDQIAHFWKYPLFLLLFCDNSLPFFDFLYKELTIYFFDFYLLWQNLLLEALRVLFERQPLEKILVSFSPFSGFSRRVTFFGRFCPCGWVRVFRLEIIDWEWGGNLSLNLSSNLEIAAIPILNPSILLSNISHNR